MAESEKRVSRSTLKLKSPAVRTSVAPAKTLVAPAKTVTRKPDAASWSDEHKRRMQADMDALGFVKDEPDSRERRG
jgi:hypothetical protein